MFHPLVHYVHVRVVFHGVKNGPMHFGCAYDQQFLLVT